MLGLNDHGLDRTRSLIDERRAIARTYDGTLAQSRTRLARPVLRRHRRRAPRRLHAEQLAAVLDLHVTEKGLSRLDERSRQSGA
ncbi:hypothetical protein ILP97_17235 [Amycolatopsis sp. H6(2020)]|nr:hypothetical protein [Amycolatopsis sp. H6(2020)]